MVFRNASSIIDDVEYAVSHFPDFAAANGIDRKFIDEIGGYFMTYFWYILKSFHTHNPQLLVISPHNLSPYFADGTDDGIADAVRNLLSPATN